MFCKVTVEISFLLSSLVFLGIKLTVELWLFGNVQRKLPYLFVVKFAFQKGKAFGYKIFFLFTLFLYTFPNQSFSVLTGMKNNC